MRTGAFVVVLAACGSSSPPQPAAPATPNDTSGGLGCVEPCALTAGQPTGKTIPAERSEQEPPPPTPDLKVSIYERLRDVAGPVPGLDAYTLTIKDDPTRCGGKLVTSTRVKKKKIAKGDEPFAAMFAIAYPTGLDFTPGPKGDDAKKQFDAFLTEAVKLGRAASDAATKQLESDDAKTKVIGAARISQYSYRFASLVARAEIPADVRTGEFAADKSAAFCDALAETAEVVLVRAEDAARACGARLAMAGDGWWSTVCVAP